MALYLPLFCLFYRRVNGNRSSGFSSVVQNLSKHEVFFVWWGRKCFIAVEVIDMKKNGVRSMTLVYKQIIVAIDGSEESEWAFKKAVAIAERNDAALNLINIVDTRSYSSAEAYDRSMAESAYKSAEEMLNNYKAEAVQAGVQNVNVLVDFGSPKAMIAKDLPKKLSADLIICGATGLNAVERFVMGSVSENIVRSAKCDVLVIRRPEHL